jgi:hypothetical protein
MKLIDIPVFQSSVNLRCSRSENATSESEPKGMEFRNKKIKFSRRGRGKESREIKTVKIEERKEKK